jgi:hypothetical protein
VFTAVGDISTYQPLDAGSLRGQGPWSTTDPPIAQVSISKCMGCRVRGTEHNCTFDLTLDGIQHSMLRPRLYVFSNPSRLPPATSSNSSTSIGQIVNWNQILSISESSISSGQVKALSGKEINGKRDHDTAGVGGEEGHDSKRAHVSVSSWFALKSESS